MCIPTKQLDFSHSVYDYLIDHLIYLKDWVILKLVQISVVDLFLVSLPL